MTDPATVHSETLGTVHLRVVIDPEPFNPRDEWDSASTMACWHRRYRLGNADGPTRLRGALCASRARRSLRQIELEDPPGLAIALTACRDIVWLPLHLYDHSGITMSTSRNYPFNDLWDAGQVGFVFMTQAQVLAEFGGPGAKRLTPQLRARAEGLMRAEVADYDRYLTGNVFGFIVENGTGDQLDSCWGFFGSSYCIEEGRASARRLADERAAHERTLVATELETSRPDVHGPALPFG